MDKRFFQQFEGSVLLVAAEGLVSCPASVTIVPGDASSHRLFVLGSNDLEAMATALIARTFRTVESAASWSSYLEWSAKREAEYARERAARARVDRDTLAALSGLLVSVARFETAVATCAAAGGSLHARERATIEAMSLGLVPLAWERDAVVSALAWDRRFGVVGLSATLSALERAADEAVSSAWFPGISPEQRVSAPAPSGLPLRRLGGTGVTDELERAVRNGDVRALYDEVVVQLCAAVDVVDAERLTDWCDAQVQRRVRSGLSGRLAALEGSPRESIALYCGTFAVLVAAASVLGVRLEREAASVAAVLLVGGAPVCVREGECRYVALGDLNGGS